MELKANHPKRRSYYLSVAKNTKDFFPFPNYFFRNP